MVSILRWSDRVLTHQQADCVGAGQQFGAVLRGAVEMAWKFCAEEVVKIVTS